MALRKILVPLLPQYLRQPSRNQDLIAWESAARVCLQQMGDLDDPATPLPLELPEYPTDRILRPDEELERKCLRQELCEEAQEVLDIIFNAPAEVLELIATPVRKNITTRKLARYLQHHLGWSGDKITRAFRDAERYAHELEQL